LIKKKAGGVTELLKMFGEYVRGKYPCIDWRPPLFIRSSWQSYNKLTSVRSLAKPLISSLFSSDSTVVCKNSELKYPLDLSVID